MAKPRKPSPGRKKGKAGKTGASKRAAGRKGKSPLPSTKKPRGSPRKRVQPPRLSRSELAARLGHARSAAAHGEPLVKSWLRGCERIRDRIADELAREPIQRAAAPPSAKRGTPWALVVRWSGFDGTLGYGELYGALARVADDEWIGDRIGHRRLCRMTVLYQGLEKRDQRGGRRVKREFTLSEISPWDVMISRAVERLNPDIEDSITASYDGLGADSTKVLAVYLWIALEEAGEVPIAAIGPR